jgi:hypothetical protein
MGAASRGEQGKRILIPLMAVGGRFCNKAHEFNILRGVLSWHTGAALGTFALTRRKQTKPWIALSLLYFRPWKTVLLATWAERPAASVILCWASS